MTKSLFLSMILRLFHGETLLRSCKVLKSGMFYPTFVSGLSGNGKTFQIEQACAKLNREYVRVQISPETDEDDLIGGFRLIKGETVFQKGPVIKAMEAGAVLMIDEIDRGTNKIMCLQGVLEGKPVLIKKTGEVVEPKDGFNIIATANTKGKGSEDGRYSGATIIDDAFLERFTITLEQTFPTIATEEKIVMKHMQKFEAIDEEFAKLLVGWADAIRKTFYDEGIDEVISTRRLCHIVQTFSIFGKRDKAIALCVNRFDDDTKAAFIDLYEKVDATINAPEEVEIDLDASQALKITITGRTNNMNLSAQEYLAKLLAKENLSVQHGNYSTASFDVVNRVLRLPLWKDKGKDVYDLLVGHEVGHALYTPADGWHDSEKKIGKIPRAYLNIVEDIRIERMIQDTYPGIVTSFQSWL